jgi:quercetin dioxygenase-like cupin family protein
MDSRTPPPRIEPAPDPVDPDLEPLLSEPFAAAWSGNRDAPQTTADPLRQRLLGRLAASKAASAAMVTARLRHVPGADVAEGVSIRTLYAAPSERPRRPGEPLRARLVELQAQAHWMGPGPAHHREWLVLRGTVHVGGVAMGPRDYRVAPAGLAAEAVHTDAGALIFLRESVLPAPGGAAFTVHDAESDWPAYAPGIRRRVLWQHDGQAALLYHAEPGASVPVHTHGHDEECLMVQGELFLDDVLLQEGDYQLAPAGTGHRITETDTGVVIYAHGDLDLKFVG